MRIVRTATAPQIMSAGDLVQNAYISRIQLMVHALIAKSMTICFVTTLATGVSRLGWNCSGLEKTNNIFYITT